MTTPDQTTKPAAGPSLEELRLSVLRKLAAVTGDPLRCRLRRCRRARRCVGEALDCLEHRPDAPPISEEEGAARLAALQKMLKRSLSEERR